MRQKTVENLNDGCVRVCLQEQTLSICTTISSHHLVDDKWRQLHTAMDRIQAESESESPQLTETNA